MRLRLRLLKALPRECKLPIVMCGCVPSRYGAEPTSSFPVAGVCSGRSRRCRLSALLADVLEYPEPTPTIVAAHGMCCATTTMVAFVKISEGCDRLWRFHAIPYVRGHHQGPLKRLFKRCMSGMEGKNSVILIARTPVLGLGYA